jgi:hypothetical protein
LERAPPGCKGEAAIPTREVPEVSHREMMSWRGHYLVGVMDESLLEVLDPKGRNHLCQ